MDTDTENDGKKNPGRLKTMSLKTLLWLNLASVTLNIGANIGAAKVERFADTAHQTMANKILQIPSVEVSQTHYPEIYRLIQDQAVADLWARLSADPQGDVAIADLKDYAPELHVKVVETNIPAAFANPQNHSIVLTSGYLRGRTPDEIKVDMIELMEKMQIGTDDWSKIDSDDQAVARVGLEPTISSLQKARRDEKSLTAQLDKELGAPKAALRFAGDIVSQVKREISSPIPDTSARIDRLLSRNSKDDPDQNRER
jgi:Zn-dependent protease with chaperone function